MELNPFFLGDLEPYDPRGSKDYVNAASLAQALLARSSALRGFEMTEEDGKFHIFVDMPRFTASDIKVETESGCDCQDCGCRGCSGSSCQCQGNRVLRISGTRGREGAMKRFDKRFTLGSNVDVGKMTAKVEHGVLEVEAPKLEPKPPKSKIIHVS